MNIFEIVTRYSSRCTYILHHTMIKFFRHSLDDPPPPTRDIRSLACCASITRRKRMIKHKSITLGNDWFIHSCTRTTRTLYYISILVFWKCNPTIPYYQWQRDIDMDVDGMLLNESIEYFDQLVAGLYRSFLSYIRFTLERLWQKLLIAY